MNRREFLRTAGGAAGGAAAASAATGSAAAAESGGGGGEAPPPDFDGYLSDVGNFDSVEDKTGQDKVTVKVGVDQGGGPYGFGPAAVHVDKGTTVVWEWTGNGSHNVIHEGGSFESELKSSGTFEHTFDSDGLYKYFCQPHKSLAMKGGVVVGTEYPTKSGGIELVEPKHMGVPFQAHFVGIATILAIAVSLVFTFFLLKYGESAHTSGGNN
jgi:halocyanin-like protein